MSVCRVVITGMGQVSPFSSSLSGFWDSLISGADGVRPYSEGGSLISAAAPASFSGHIDEFETHDSAQQKAIKKSLKVMSREIQMAVAASSRALHHAEIQFGQFPSNRVGISFGSDYIVTTPADVLDGIRNCCTKSTQPQFDFSKWGKEGIPKMSPLWQLKYLPNMPASHIAILNQFHGPSNSMTLREASIGAVIGESAAIIAAGLVDIMLAGTTGSRIHPIKLIHAATQEPLAEKECRPFDRNRSGTILGEGAGAIVLESQKHAENRGAKIWGEVAAASYRFRASSSVFHQTKGQSDQKQKVIQSVLHDVLRRGNVKPEQLGHINAHGLGSVESDLAESKAIRHVFETDNRKCSDTLLDNNCQSVLVAAAKGHFGNLGAGGGAVELIASLLALDEGQLFPTLHFTEYDPVSPLIPTCGNEKSGDSFVKIAFNSQGQASAVLVKKWK
ncbi:MAG: beta-ketoacyl-[acyl-carrier-protein] synthase family protein [Thermoguttaceae bacterium]